MSKRRICARILVALTFAMFAPLSYAAAQTAGATTSSADPPARYEVSIDGEHFTLDGGRLTKLTSTQKPGTVFEVAVRLAEYQRWQLDNVRFDYHLGFSVADDRTASTRSAMLKHGIGFVMVVTNLGGKLSMAQQQKTIDEISQTIQKTTASSGGANIAASTPQQQKMGNSQVRGLTISYDDADGVEHLALVYLVCGQTFTCSCIVECLEADRDDVMPLIKPTLDSFESTGEKKPPAKSK